jgi:hypothetical protein
MVLIGRARVIWRQIAALTGALAILLQAILFAWHHHAFAFHPQAASAVALLATPTPPATPAADDRDCQICFTLCHHGAVPVDFFAPSAPVLPSLHQIRPATLDAPLAPYFAFQSRAPPAA